MIQPGVRPASTSPQVATPLHFQTRGVIKDIERLKSLFELFAAVLERLCRMGAAYERGAGVVL